MLGLGLGLTSPAVLGRHQVQDTWAAPIMGDETDGLAIAFMSPIEGKRVLLREAGVDTYMSLADLLTTASGTFGSGGYTVAAGQAAYGALPEPLQSPSEMSMFVDVDMQDSTSTKDIAAVDTGSSANRLVLFRSGSTVIRTVKSVSATSSLGPVAFITAANLVQAAGAWKDADFATVAQHGTAATSAVAGALPGVTRLILAPHYYSSGNQDITFRRLLLVPRRVPDADLPSWRYTAPPNLITNGDFASGLSGWTAGSDWSWAAGKAQDTGTNSDTRAELSQTLSTVSGATYRLTFTISNIAGGSPSVLLNGSNLVSSISTPGTITATFTGTGSDTLTWNGANATYVIDNVSVVRI